jgi:hypothetical protein
MSNEWWHLLVAFGVGYIQATVTAVWVIRRQLEAPRTPCKDPPVRCSYRK